MNIYVVVCVQNMYVCICVFSILYVYMCYVCVWCMYCVYMCGGVCVRMFKLYICGVCVQNMYHVYVYFLYEMFKCMCGVCVCVFCISVFDTLLEARGQLYEVNFLLPPLCGLQNSNSCFQAFMISNSPSESIYWSSQVYFIWKMLHE